MAATTWFPVLLLTILMAKPAFSSNVSRDFPRPTYHPTIPNQTVKVLTLTTVEMSTSRYNHWNTHLRPSSLDAANYGAFLVNVGVISRTDFQRNAVVRAFPKEDDWETSNSTIRKISLHRKEREVDDALTPTYDISIERPESKKNKYIIRVERDGEETVYASTHTYDNPWGWVSAASASKGTTSKSICDQKITRRRFNETGQTIRIPDFRPSEQCDRFAVSFCHAEEHADCYVDIINGFLSGKFNSTLVREYVSEKGMDRLVPGRRVLSATQKTEASVDATVTPTYDIFIERPESKKNKYIIRVEGDGEETVYASTQTYDNPWGWVSAASASEGTTSKSICDQKITRRRFNETGQTIRIPDFRPSEQCDRFAVSFCHEEEHEDCYVDIIYGFLSGKLNATLVREYVSEKGIDRLVPGRTVHSATQKTEASVKGTPRSYNIIIERPVSDNFEYVVRVLRDGQKTPVYTSTETYDSPWKWVSAASASEGNTSKAVCDPKITRRRFTDEGQAVRIPNFQPSPPCDRLAVSLCQDEEHQSCSVLVVTGFSSGELTSSKSKEFVSEQGEDRLVPGREVQPSTPKAETTTKDTPPRSYDLSIERLVSDDYKYVVRVVRDGEKVPVYRSTETYDTPWKWVSAASASEGDTFKAICDEKITRRSFSDEGQIIRINNFQPSQQCDRMAISFCLDEEHQSCSVLVVTGFSSGELSSSKSKEFVSEQGEDRLVPGREVLPSTPEAETTTASVSSTGSTSKTLREDEISYNITIKKRSQKFFIRLETDQHDQETTPITNKGNAWLWVSAGFYSEDEDGNAKECETFITRRRMQNKRAIESRGVKSKCPILGISLCEDEDHNSCYVVVFDKLLQNDFSHQTVKQFVSKTGYKWIPGRGLKTMTKPDFLQIAQELRNMLAEERARTGSTRP